jgi:hypothetical protein
MVVPLSTNVRMMPTHVILTEGIEGLMHESLAKCEQITLLTSVFWWAGRWDNDYRTHCSGRSFGLSGALLASLGRSRLR